MSGVGFIDEPQPRARRAGVWALTMAVLIPAGWGLWQLGVIVGGAVVRAFLPI